MNIINNSNQNDPEREEFGEYYVSLVSQIKGILNKHFES